DDSAQRDAPLLILYTSAEPPRRMQIRQRAVHGRADMSATEAKREWRGIRRAGSMSARAKENSMPHLKCVSCRTRYHTPGGRADPIEDLCPGCGSAFEPVADLSALVGLCEITTREGPQQGLVERLGGLLDRRARDHDE